MTTHFLYIAALASMLILLGTVFIVVRGIWEKSQRDDSDVERDVPKRTSAARKRASVQDAPEPAPLKNVSAFPPLALRADGARPQLRPQPVVAASMQRRLAQSEMQSVGPKSGLVLLGMMTGAAILLLVHAQKRSQKQSMDSRETSRGEKDAC